MAFRPKPDNEARPQSHAGRPSCAATYARPKIMSSLRTNIMYPSAVELCSTPVHIVEYQYSWLKQATSAPAQGLHRRVACLRPRTLGNVLDPAMPLFLGTHPMGRG